MKKNRFLNQISKNQKKVIITLFFSFAAFCSVIIGLSWDEGFHLLQGKITLNYLTTFGYVNEQLFYREFYSPIYFTFTYLITSIFPKIFEVQVQHLINTIVSFSALFGIAKMSKELFNKEIAYLSFLILFFYPIFFGHMGINGKDIILATCHVWITYSILRYLKKQSSNNHVNKYLINIAFLAAIGTGIQLLYLGSFLTIIIFILFDIFFLKKFSNKNFSIKKFILDLIKCFLIFYLLLILFWIDVHPNIIKLPTTILMKLFSDSFWTGWPYTLINGNYFLSTEVPSSYYLINIFYKTPIYIIYLYLLSGWILFYYDNYFTKKFKFFYYKLSFILSIFFFPNLLIILLSIPIYDGLRLFLWAIPYIVILPSCVIYFLLKNTKFFFNKVNISILFVLLLYFLYNFFLITPYQYTYLNMLAGSGKNNFQLFENDYWGASTKELIKKSNLDKNKNLKIGLCGINNAVASKYLKIYGYKDFSLVKISDAEYIFMTNRTVIKDVNSTEKNNITNCFEKYKGSKISSVNRIGNQIAIIKKIN